MIHIKSPQELISMTTGGKILAEVLGEVFQNVRPGVSESELDGLAETLIREKGAEPGFMKVRGYKHTICVSTNNIVVHGIPGSYQLKEGDVIGIDCGVYYKGLHTDMSETLRVKNQKSPIRHPSIQLRTGAQGKNQKNEVDLFLETGKRALEEAIKQAKAGNRVGHISLTIQEIVEEAGYSVVRNLVGHGVGRQLHEEPEVPGFLAEPIKKTPLLKEGMTIAIEVIYNMGAPDVVYSNDDGWTIKTRDGSLSGVFEKTVAVTKEDPIVLTR